mmetsp:Transcript_16855/g.43712  ORF Transcript_16855/g.43712 Transcript_16855/m.43712 type:complete len:205 (+) Transcript_16855:281-895(+)
MRRAAAGGAAGRAGHGRRQLGGRRRPDVLHPPVRVGDRLGRGPSLQPQAPHPHRHQPRRLSAARHRRARRQQPVQHGRLPERGGPCRRVPGADGGVPAAPAGRRGGQAGGVHLAGQFLGEDARHRGGVALRGLPAVRRQGAERHGRHLRSDTVQPAQRGAHREGDLRRPAVPGPGAPLRRPKAEPRRSLQVAGEARPPKGHHAG